jgi:hypothetical protein
MKKLQILFTDEAWSVVESSHRKAVDGFESGTISYSDVINELILNATIDIKVLQSKRVDLRRFLRNMAAKEDLNVDEAMKVLAQFSGRSVRKRARPTLGDHGHE